MMHPKTHIELLSVFPKDCMTLVGARRVDLAITAMGTVPPEVCTEFLWRDPFYLVCNTHHMLTRKACIDLHDLCRFPFVHYAPNTLARDQIDHAVQPHQLQVACETAHIHTIKALVEAGEGISLATELSRRVFTSVSLATRPIAGDCLARDIGLIWHASRPMSHAVAKLVEMIRDAVP